jgi:hypothetical protein
MRPLQQQSLKEYQLMRIESLLLRLGYERTWDYIQRQYWLLDPANFTPARTPILNSANIGPKKWQAFLNYMGLKENIIPVHLGHL